MLRAGSRLESRDRSRRAANRLQRLQERRIGFHHFTETTLRSIFRIPFHGLAFASGPPARPYDYIPPAITADRDEQQNDAR
ncbi:hypothetical protein SAMN02800692_1820 [Luteibacter sp. UNC138MFCol5.1]|nr:hypothetical protein SAMN02800692_1820 [Luteibacter sp. UNC138MFCol5.1]